MHMRCQARQLDSYSTARHCSTARQLDRTRQTSTDLDAPAHGVSLDLPRRARQPLDSYSTASRQARHTTGKALTAPRQRPRQRLDGASTARQLDSQGSRSLEWTIGRPAHARSRGSELGRGAVVALRGVRRSSTTQRVRFGQFARSEKSRYSIGDNTVQRPGAQDELDGRRGLTPERLRD